VLIISGSNKYLYSMFYSVWIQGEKMNKILLLLMLSIFVVACDDNKTVDDESDTAIENAKEITKNIDTTLYDNMSSEEKNYAFIIAARSGDIDTVKNYVESGIDVNAKYYDKEFDEEFTALILASWHGEIEVVKYLVKNSADMNATDNDGYTALIWASMYGEIEVVKYLVEKGTSVTSLRDTGSASTQTRRKAADINIGYDSNNTALFMASLYGETEVVKLLVSSGTSVRKAADISKMTIVQWADSGWFEKVKESVDTSVRRANNEDVNTTDEGGYTPLINASFNGDLEIVKYLVDNGADVNIRNAQGETALMNAVKIGYIEVVKYLVAEGTDVNVKDINGTTIIDIAFLYNNIEIIKYLLNNGVDKSNIDITIWARLGDLDRVKSALSTNTIDINLNNGELLRNAVQSGNLELVTYLVEKGANIHEETFETGNALITASATGNLEIVKYLIEQGININSFIEYSGETAIEIAKEEGHTEIVKLLIDAGTSVTSLRDTGSASPTP